MDKVAFFGASVTQQKEGYWKYFADLNRNFYIKNFGYGGMHLHNAGMVYIDEVLQFRPEYCFVDWFGTHYINERNFEEIKQNINTLAYRFFSRNVKLVFLIFPDKFLPRGEIYTDIGEYARSIGIEVIDMRKSFDNLDTILKDQIHTTKYGSDQYAKIITQVFYDDIFVKLEIPKKYPDKNKYCDIKKINIESDIFERMDLSGDCEVLGLLQIVGPYTGIVKVNETIFKNWDRWCYYERESINTRFAVKGKASLEVLQDDFDRSTCQHQCDWSVRKQLKLKGIYYIGKELKVLDYI